MAAHPQNIIAAQLRRLRNEAALSQQALASRCQRIGWDASRDILKHIEEGVRRVSDAELVILAAALRVDLLALMPKGGQALKRLAVPTAVGKTE